MMPATEPGQQPIRQACAIPFRRRDDGIEFCLITLGRKKRWGFPKGIIDPGETDAETALKEAYEEAGVRGRIIADPLGTYEYSKWGTTLVVTVLLMEVTRAESRWQEADFRQRQWTSPERALQLLSGSEQKPFLQAALRHFECS